MIEELQVSKDLQELDIQNPALRMGRGSGLVSGVC